ncbi:MAG TPA: hypothetical protein VM261_21145 [Kofleriaceae bacterium]|nr:hypothetical protein [Kofleriaceae bacterium]
MASERFLVGAALVAMIASALASTRPAAADIEGDSFLSETYGLRATLPRGWRITESTGYPRTLLWLSRSKPRVRISVAVDPIAADCRTGATFCNRDPSSVSQTLEAHLRAAGFDVRGSSSPSRTPTLDYTIGRAHLRHAIVIVGDWVVSVIIAADSPADLSTMARTFDRIVQSIRPLAPAQ